VSLSTRRGFFWLLPGIYDDDRVINIDGAIKAETDRAGDAHWFQQGEVKSGGHYGAESKAEQGNFGNVDNGLVHCGAPLGSIFVTVICLIIAVYAFFVERKIYR
jgi:hypothetical protein